MAPDVLGDEMEPLESGKLEKIDPKNREDLLPGDLLETRDTEHDIDETTAPTQAGGKVQGESKGGERVWQNELMPDEQKALKQFFGAKSKTQK